MKVIPLQFNRKVYTCSSYFLVDFAEPSGQNNILIDVGSDGYTIREIADITKDTFEQAVGRVILTHSHSDHNGGLAEIIDKFKPQVYAFWPNPGVDHTLAEGDVIKAGDKDIIVLHTPGHSEDSICLYCLQTGELFSGDLQLTHVEPYCTYPLNYLISLEKLSKLDVKVIYPGHSRPITQGCNEIIRLALETVKKIK